MNNDFVKAPKVFPKGSQLEITADGRSVIRFGKEVVPLDGTLVVDAEDEDGDRAANSVRWVDFGHPDAHFCTSDFARLKAGQEYKLDLRLGNDNESLERVGALFTTFLAVNDHGTALFELQGAVFHNLDEPPSSGRVAVPPTDRKGVSVVTSDSPRHASANDQTVPLAINESDKKGCS